MILLFSQTPTKFWRNDVVLFSITPYSKDYRHLVSR